MSIPVFQVDAFTNRPFRGNPAAVCVMRRAADEQWMQDVAREMNLSETAFLRPQEGAWNLRWFTPKVEVLLCGHATLASAHVLWETGRLDEREEAVFDTKSGTLRARRTDDWIEMDFPSGPGRQMPVQHDIVEALGAEPVNVLLCPWDLLVELESEDAVRALQPDFRRLAEVPIAGGVIVTAKASTEGFDFVSRMFAPRLGIDEDPVTGSAHCSLGPYWQERLGKDDMVAYQASERGGVVRVHVGLDRVFISGQAVTVMRGEITR